MRRDQPGLRPQPSFWNRLDVVARASFPSVCTAILLVLLSAPLRLPGQAQLLVSVAMISVFFWSLYRPYSLPPVLVFGLGLLMDLLGTEPFGLFLLLLLTLHGTVLLWQRSLVRRGFWQVWLVFGGMTAVAALLQWVLMSVLLFRLLPVVPVLFQCILSIGLYPALAFLFGAAHRGIAAPEEA